TITHRRGQTRFLQPADEESGTPEGRAAAQLCRLAFELAKAADPMSLAKIALGGLFDGIGVDAGALLLLRQALPRDADNTHLVSAAAGWEVVASRSDTAMPYHRISPFLAATVISKGEAVLARNVLGDSTVSVRDSKGEIYATSVLCAPVRRGKTIFG